MDCKWSMKGLQQIIIECVLECMDSVSSPKLFLDNIILCGQSCQFKGLKERLVFELNGLIRNDSILSKQVCKLDITSILKDGHSCVEIEYISLKNVVEHVKNLTFSKQWEINENKDV